MLLTTYGMVQHNASFLCTPPSLRHADEEEEEKPLWDFMILDEVWGSLLHAASLLASVL